MIMKLTTKKPLPIWYQEIVNTLGDAVDPNKKFIHRISYNHGDANGLLLQDIREYSNGLFSRRVSCIHMGAVR